MGLFRGASCISLHELAEGRTEELQSWDQYDATDWDQLTPSPLSDPSWAADVPPSSADLHAIVVADTDRGPCGTSFNRTLMIEFLHSVKEMGFGVHLELLHGSDVSPGNIIAAIRRADASRMRERTLLLYYAGHGGTDYGAGHFLRTPAGDLSREALLKEIRGKAPQLAVLLTDTCSIDARLKQPAVEVGAGSVRHAVENLFFHHRGVVDINASTYRPDQGLVQAAFYSPVRGGLFTRAFINMFLPWRDGGSLDRERPEERTSRPRSSSQDAMGHAERFGNAHLWEYDRDHDGFIEWSDAIDYLGEVVPTMFESFKSLVRDGRLIKLASSEDVHLLMTQLSQDPQVSGPLAVPIDRPIELARKPAIGSTARSPRLGAVLENRVERGGAFVEVTGIDPASPASRVTLWKGGQRSQVSVPLRAGDTIVRANRRRIRNRDDLFWVMDDVPEGGELNITGYRSDSGGESRYEATVHLDRFG